MSETNNRLIGDQVADLMEKTGVTSLVEKAAKAVGVDDCGCKARQKRLNALHRKVIS